MSIKECLEAFLSHAESLGQVDDYAEDGFTREFQQLKARSNHYRLEGTYPTTEGEKDCNRRKNRYKDILPFDHTRVILNDTGTAGSDYINANFLKGATGHRTYIASQGPLPTTVLDFWRMIWDYDVRIVIMACNEYEGQKLKCARYWPGKSDPDKKYGSIIVSTEQEAEGSSDKHFISRTFRVRNGEVTRTVYQYHYVAWPDHGVPSTPSLLDMIALVRERQPHHLPPLLVHCSAGCGRTGTICAIDYAWSMLKLGKLNMDFNMFDLISDMRRQRHAIVQARDQYVVVHQAVSELFRHHLKLIEQHLYENVDSNGHPKLVQDKNLIPYNESPYDLGGDMPLDNQDDDDDDGQPVLPPKLPPAEFVEVSPIHRAVKHTVTNLINSQQIEASPGGRQTHYTDSSPGGRQTHYTDSSPGGRMPKYTSVPTERDDEKAQFASLKKTLNQDNFTMSENAKDLLQLDLSCTSDEFMSRQDSPQQGPSPKHRPRVSPKPKYSPAAGQANVTSDGGPPVSPKKSDSIKKSHSMDSCLKDNSPVHPNLGDRMCTSWTEQGDGDMVVVNNKAKSLDNGCHDDQNHVTLVDISADGVSMVTMKGPQQRKRVGTPDAAEVFNPLYNRKNAAPAKNRQENSQPWLSGQEESVDNFLYLSGDSLQTQSDFGDQDQGETVSNLLYASSDSSSSEFTYFGVDTIQRNVAQIREKIGGAVSDALGKAPRSPSGSKSPGSSEVKMSTSSTVMVDNQSPASLPRQAMAGSLDSMDEYAQVNRPKMGSTDHLQYSQAFDHQRPRHNSPAPNTPPPGDYMTPPVAPPRRRSRPNSGSGMPPSGHSRGHSGGHSPFEGASGGGAGGGAYTVTMDESGDYICITKPDDHRKDTGYLNRKDKLRSSASEDEYQHYTAPRFHDSGEPDDLRTSMDTSGKDTRGKALGRKLLEMMNISSPSNTLMRRDLSKPAVVIFKGKDISFRNRVGRPRDPPVNEEIAQAAPSVIKPNKRKR